MFIIRVVVFALLAKCGAAHGADSPPVQMEPAPKLPKNWAIVGDAPSDSMIELIFAVKQRGLQDLHDTLMRVSTPSSPEYGQHLSNEKVHSLTTPAREHIYAVEQFLAQHAASVMQRSSNSDLISVKVSIETAEHMLSTDYVELEHGPSGTRVIRTTGGYKLPASVAAAVDFVSPTVNIPGVRSHKLARNEGPVSLALVNSPKNLRKLYNISVEGKAVKNRMAVTGFLGQGYSKTALHLFWGQFCSNGKADGIHCGKGDPKTVGDHVHSVLAGTEMMLDIETITGVAGNVEAEVWGFGGKSPDNPANEPFMKWLLQVSNTADEEVPKIFSVSYGEDESSWSYSAAQRLNVEFQKAGVRGISILYAAGDEGANCKEDKYVPEGPGSSPYVTSVGGTQSTNCWPNPGCEDAIGLGSGGFSNYWKMPDYQKDAVTAYLKKEGLPDLSAYAVNVSGRAYPDISAQASNFYVWAALPEPLVMGTSCAAPTASGIFALLNDVRMQAGKSSLGFLNPLIYQSMAAFNDVTKGANVGCRGHAGWPAKDGWDAATGVGTPNFAKLAKVVAELGNKSSIFVV